MPRAVLSALCALPLACSSTSLDAQALIQGGAHVQRELPLELSDTLLTLERQAEAVKQDKGIQDLGDFSWNSGTSAVRLKDSSSMSQAWGVDKVKGIGAIGQKRGDFVGGGLLTAGTDTRQSYHSLGGAAYTGLDPNNKKKLPSSYGVVAGSEVKPGFAKFVGAVPVEDPRDGPSLGWGQLEAEVGTGHMTPGQLQEWLKGKANTKAEKVVSTPTPAKMEQKAEKATSTPPPAKTEQKAERASSTLAPAKMEQKAVTATGTPAPAKMVQNATAADLKKLEVLPELDPMGKEWVEDLLKLMFLDFPFESAYWFNTMKSWAKGNRLPAEEASRQLAKLQGRWLVEKDSEMPESEGRQVTIKDAQLFSANGDNVLGTQFQAYSGNWYGVVSLLQSPFDNSTVQLYKLFKVNGTKIEFQGGNVWQRLSGPPEITEEPPSSAEAAAKPAGTEPAPAREAGGSDFWKKLGGSLSGQKGQEQVEEADGSDLWKKLGGSLFGQKGQEQAKEAGGSDLWKKLGGSLFGEKGQEQAKEVGGWLQTLQGLLAKK